MKIAIGGDHASPKLKAKVVEFLKAKGIEVTDYGTYDSSAVDYPDYALKVAEAVVAKEADLGILICGTGIGMSLAANKVKGIRAACCSEHFSAKYTRLHNDSNILCLGGRVIGVGTAIELADLFVDTEFEGGRHQTRVDKVMKIENEG